MELVAYLFATVTVVVIVAVLLKRRVGILFSKKGLKIDISPREDGGDCHFSMSFWRKLI